MEAKFSPRVKDVITYSREEALRLGHDYIGTEHLLLGIIREGEGTAVRLLKSLGVDLMELRKTIEQTIGTGNHKVSNLANIPLMKQAERALKITYLEAKLFKSPVIGTEHLILSILKDEDNVATKTLHNLNYLNQILRLKFPGLHKMKMQMMIHLVPVALKSLPTVNRKLLCLITLAVI